MHFALLLSSLFFFLSAHAASLFTLTSPAFIDKGNLPALYTCDGFDVSPELVWSNVPRAAKSFVLIVSDPDATSGVLYHWLVYNLPPDIKGLPEGVRQLPEGSLEGKNSWNHTNYKGPCPPKGTSHHYYFTLYALDTMLTLPAEWDEKILQKALGNHVVGKTQLMAVYP